MLAGRRPIYKGKVVDLGLEQATLPHGVTIELEVVRHPGAAAVVPLHEDGSVTLVHQHRHAGGGMFYEVPAGKLDGGEPPLQCAVRELAEEVQLQAERFELLTAIHTTPGFTDERIWLYRATGLHAAEGRPEFDEYIRVVRLPGEQALEMIRRGQITDGKTICALYLALSARI
jgi:ADP-ribose pyrophosphatase